MKQLTVTIPDEFYNSFIEFFKHIPDVKIDENIDFEVPEWQKEIVLERMKNAKPEDYRNWEDVKKELDKKWNFNG
jgi:hypothetical protein